MPFAPWTEAVTPIATLRVVDVNPAGLGSPRPAGATAVAESRVDLDCGEELQRDFVGVTEAQARPIRPVDDLAVRDAQFGEPNAMWSRPTLNSPNSWTAVAACGCESEQRAVGRFPDRMVETVAAILVAVGTAPSRVSDDRAAPRRR